LDSDNDPGFLLEPLADRRQALPFGFGSSDLRPQGAQLASLGGRLFPAPLCEAVFGLSDPLLLGFCVFLAFRHSTNSLRCLST
jgi:hypothetical protein